MRYIILHTDTWAGLTITINHLGKPKIFTSEDEAYHYAKDFELTPFQIVEVTIE